MRHHHNGTRTFVLAIIAVQVVSGKAVRVPFIRVVCKEGKRGDD
jgi:hypothetical protein